MRLIDADALETHEMYDGEFVQVVYKDDIDEAPIVERPYEKKGYYIRGKNGEWYCSACKRVDDKYSVANFCWYCGADMRTMRKQAVGFPQELLKEG